MSEKIDINVKKLEQRTHQVYEISPWVAPEDVESKLIKYLKKLRITSEDVREVIAMLGKNSVEEIAKQLRSKGKPIAAIDLHKVFETLRDQGYMRVVTTKAPVRVTEVKTEVMSVVVEAPPEEVPPTEVPSPEEVLSEEIPIPEVPMPEIPEVTEVTVVGGEMEVVGVPVSPVGVLTEELKQKIDQIRSAGILDRYFNMNEHLKGIAMMPREGNMILLSSYREGVNMADAEVAVASTTIINHATNAAETTQMGGLKELIVDSDNGYLLLARLPNDVVLVGLFDPEATLGLMIRDFLALKNELSEILASE